MIDWDELEKQTGVNKPDLPNAFKRGVELPYMGRDVKVHADGTETIKSLNFYAEMKALQSKKLERPTVDPEDDNIAHPKTTQQLLDYFVSLAADIMDWYGKNRDEVFNRIGQTTDVLIRSGFQNAISHPHPHRIPLIPQATPNPKITLLPHAPVAIVMFANIEKPSKTQGLGRSQHYQREVPCLRSQDAWVNKATDRYNDSVRRHEEKTQGKQLRPKRSFMRMPWQDQDKDTTETTSPEEIDSFLHGHQKLLRRHQTEDVQPATEASSSADIGGNAGTKARSATFPPHNTTLLPHHHNRQHLAVPQSQETSTTEALPTSDERPAVPSKHAYHMPLHLRHQYSPPQPSTENFDPEATQSASETQQPKPKTGGRRRLLHDKDLSHQASFQPTTDPDVPDPDVPPQQKPPNMFKDRIPLFQPRAAATSADVGVESSKKASKKPVTVHPSSTSTTNRGLSAISDSIERDVEFVESAFAHRVRTLEKPVKAVEEVLEKPFKREEKVEEASSQRGEESGEGSAGNAAEEADPWKEWKLDEAHWKIK